MKALEEHKRENLMILKCSYHFANVSGTKAPIFVKFETHAPKVVMDYQNNFHKDPCTNMRTRDVNVRTRDETCTCTFAPHVRVCVH